MAVMLVYFVVHINSYAQSKTDSLFVKLLQQDTNAVVKKVISDPQTHRLQIIYTQIDRINITIPLSKIIISM
jgi:hypothetical protein